jgi:HEAT repeats
MRPINRKRLVLAFVVLTLIAAAAVYLLLFRTGPEIASPDAQTPAPAARAPRTKGPPSEAEISRMLRDTLWQRRSAAAWGLTDRNDIPVPRRAQLLLDVLQREVASPTRAPAMAGSWEPLTGFLRIHYLHALETLGSNARDPVSKAYKASSGELREWYALALGATLNPDGAPPLRELLARSQDPDVRMTAARYLGWLRDRGAESVLRAALSDTATAEIVTDVPGRPPRNFFPVREQAAAALEEMGFKVTRQGSTYTVQ